MRWDDPDTDKYFASHNKQDWGWEFIRRDDRYIKEWKDVLRKFEQTPAEHVLMPYLMTADVSQYSDRKGMVGAALNHVTPAEIDTFVIPHDGAMKWGLRYYQDPRANKIVQTNRHAPMMLHRGDTTFQDAEDVCTVAVDDHSLIIVIDLTKPLTPQLVAIKERAKLEQGKLRKVSPSKVKTKAEKVSTQDQSLWATYLRCIDARIAGVKRSTAAPIIFPHAAQTPELKWDEAIKQVSKIAAGYYRPFMS